MTNGEDDLLFSDEDAPARPRSEPASRETERSVQPWKVLIVDDEQQVHAVTRMVLGDFEFKGAPLEFISAYSAAESREILRAQDDVAVILLDVVMETDDAGLELARWIREDLLNPWLRIILRTGQPGQAPERQVIVEYDINDYKEKSELTAQKLFSTMVTALRSYKDIITIETSRRGLIKIIDASASLFQIRSMEKFLSGILLQIGSLLETSVDAVLVSVSLRGDIDASSTENLRVMAASGRFMPSLNGNAANVLEEGVWREILNVVESRHSLYETDHSIVYFHSRTNRLTVLYIETHKTLHKVNHSLIHLFCRNASIGLDNLCS